MPKLTIEFANRATERHFIQISGFAENASVWHSLRMIRRQEHLFMIKAKDFYFAMQDLDAWLLRNTEYGLADDFKDQNQQEVEKTLSVVRAKLAHYLQARNVSLDMLS